MKEVIAIVRMNMMNRTKQALTEIGVSAFFAHEALGRGKGLVNHLVLQGAAQGREEALTILGEKDKLYPKRMVTVVVPDRDVDEVVQAVIAANRTGKPGDGRIFVLPVADAVRIRTAESGEKSIT
jgi:nitrogen regulatory protein PII 2